MHASTKNGSWRRKVERFVAFALLALCLTSAIPAFAGYSKQVLTFPAGASYGFPVPDHYEYAINVVHYENTAPCIHAKTIFMVHGFGDNSGVFEPLAIALINSGKACHVLAMDLPAHGASQVSTDTRFGPRIWGTIDVDEYTMCLDQVLTTLYKKQNVPIDTIVGHSTGGLAIQRLQSKYMGQLSSIQSKFGITKTILLASDIPGALPWASGDAPISMGYAKGLVVSYAQTLPAPYGTRVPLDYGTYIALKYSVNNMPVSGAPTSREALLLNNPEPYAAAANIVGLDPSGATTATVPRLDVAPGLWSGLNLIVAWPSQDLFFSQSEMDGLANYLKPGTQAVVVSDPEAVHLIQYTKPQLLLPLF